MFNYVAINYFVFKCIFVLGKDIGFLSLGKSIGVVTLDFGLGKEILDLCGLINGCSSRF